MEKEITLFKLSKTGKLQEFTVIAREVEDGAVLITRKGYVDGALQEDIEPMYPKNVGRANETEPYDQALIMLNSKVNKLYDKGYKLVEEGVTYGEIISILTQARGTDVNGKYLPMLAQKDVNKIHYPGYCQRKYDGVRCIGTSLELRSRRGKVFNTLIHLRSSLPSLPAGWEFDGELYHHDKSLQQIVSMVKREQPSNKEIIYRIYDIIAPGVPYNRRKKYLSGLEFGPGIQLVETYRINDGEEMMGMFNQFLEEGYEGLMWRDPKAVYGVGERSWGLIKVKDVLEEEFEIIGMEEATGRDAGTAIFVMQTEDGVVFKARPMGSRGLRAKYLQEVESIKGEMATVRFQQWTDEGKPFHGRVVNIRDYEIQGG